MWNFIEKVGLIVFGWVLNILYQNWRERKKRKEDKKQKEEEKEEEKEIEKLKASLSNKQVIHEHEFKKEFETYDYLWMWVAHFERDVRAFYDKSDEPIDRDGQLKKIKKDLHEVKETTINNHAFISEEVAVKVQQLIDLSIEPFIAYAERKETNIEGLRKIGEEITKISGEIEKAIQGRIGHYGRS